MTRPAGEPGDAPASLWKRLGWFVLLWLGGIAAVSLLGLIIRSVLIG
ncbi:DUF2474 domain-containing protein [Aurantimonas aggregata]|uniref:DUF2474 domain-containing protein n=1 Tax=Aurantimonas aggregata TaxID=2047720 RepID=A0A6L9MEF5_9HYPH|nr:DUF2474 domain-containing protein [Aurantimonas aggregata]NDV86046.1 DUF2474 domain-containing protein [Aurantimonas aggregata]